MTYFVMPGVLPGIRVLAVLEVVDGRNTSGRDEKGGF